ncbi:exonuclease domain-containing protein [Cucumibacter marinus]|uniref:exonuclease domain-containing protein n=1 Tax=Cucumibacter marinus TaxID=1121252 RepID=UPI000424B85C|nr:exonuclease domain-containing protein [Cucumibacter marinus]
MSEIVTYVVTDIETNGLSPIRHSMLSLASVAIDQDGNTLSEFEANLSPLTDRTTDQVTDEFWTRQPEAHAAATTGAEPADNVMARYRRWVEGLPRPRLFAARPLAFDGGFVDHYLDRFTGCRTFWGDEHTTPLFDGAGLDMASFAAALMGPEHVTKTRASFETSWYGGHDHSHKAIEDARGYAAVLGRLLKLSTGARGAIQTA